MPWRRPLVEFHVLTSILYGQASYIMRSHTKPAIILKLGPMALAMRLESRRLRQALKRLHTDGYLTELRLLYGMAQIKVEVPPNLVLQQEEASNVIIRTTA